LQYNKRDVPRVLPVSEMNAKLNFHGVPVIEAVASRGTGVLETLKTAIHGVVGRVQKVI
jgi:signal recognition particle receptor subunit beta